MSKLHRGPGCNAGGRVWVGAKSSFILFVAVNPLSLANGVAFLLTTKYSIGFCATENSFLGFLQNRQNPVGFTEIFPIYIIITISLCKQTWPKRQKAHKIHKVFLKFIRN